MIHFATTCIDNFFKYPDAIRDYANSLEFYSEFNSIPKNFPGKRTKEISLINPKLAQYINAKYLYNHYSSNSSIQFKTDMYFQKISGEFDKGWIHSDDRIVHTTIMYLTPNAQLDSGTSLWIPKKGSYPLIEDINDTEIKLKFYTNKISSEEAEKHRLKWNDNFDEVTRFANVYNRCIGFDGSQWHSANNFSQTDKKEERLTLIIFWVEIVGSQTGLQRTQMEVI